MASVLKLNRNAATVLAVYDPVGTGVNAAQNVDSWNCQGQVQNFIFCQNFQNFGPKLALTVCGFRQWVEHFQSGLSEWLEKWEIERLRKEKEAREAALAAAREVKGVTVDLCFLQIRPFGLKSLEFEKYPSEAANETNESTTELIPNPESVFIMPDSLKQQEQNKSASEKDVKVAKKKSSSSRKALKVECGTTLYTALFNTRADGQERTTFDAPALAQFHPLLFHTLYKERLRQKLQIELKN